MTLSEFLSSAAAETPHLMLVGRPVGHSLSPLMHNTAASHYGMELRYRAVEVEEEELGRLFSHFRSGSFRGANVTIPYKQRMLPAVDGLKEEAGDLQALNTIVPRQDRLEGYNTDVHGFLQPLLPLAEQLEGRGAVIFGTGGAARAACLALRRLGLGELTLVSRSPQRRDPPLDDPDLRVAGYGSWQARADEARLFVNTTPLGMHPDTGESPVREGEYAMLEGKIVYDIVYRPLETALLRGAKEAGARTIDGLEMFIHQGSRSFELWTGRPFPIERIRQKLHEYLQA